MESITCSYLLPAFLCLCLLHLLEVEPSDGSNLLVHDSKLWTNLGSKLAEGGCILIACAIFSSPVCWKYFWTEWSSILGIRRRIIYQNSCWGENSASVMNMNYTNEVERRQGMVDLRADRRTKFIQSEGRLGDGGREIVALKHMSATKWCLMSGTRAFQGMTFRDKPYHFLIFLDLPDSPI